MRVGDLVDRREGEPGPAVAELRVPGAHAVALDETLARRRDALVGVAARGRVPGAGKGPAVSASRSGSGGDAGSIAFSCAPGVLRGAAASTRRSSVAIGLERLALVALLFSAMPSAMLASMPIQNQPIQAEIARAETGSSSRDVGDEVVRPPLRPG